MLTELSKTYNPATVEDKWYQYWLDHKFFASSPNPDKEPYTIVIPPPNVTGVLHMGHMLNNTIQDVLVRKARMEGKEALWVPGTDHASIATEAKVVAMLKERGISKKDISREEFLKYAWEWKEKYGGIILQQLKKLGASCDWDRTRFTMEDVMTESVIGVFVDLYKKGHIYRGIRMVNWDPQGKTALSDEEVIYKDVQSKLYYIRYQLADNQQSTTGSYVTIATTRPETIMADTAVCINPNDKRYFHLHGKKVLIPLINKEIPIILDEYVTMDFGTGCLKVTPAHDLNDYELGLKHKLPVVDILNDDGTLNANAQIYVGMDRFAVRKKIAADLETAGQIEKVEEYKSNIGYSERTNAVIEPKLSLQWFLKLSEISKPALENVMNDTIRLHPSKFKNMYRSWMENVHDWCVSRQLWWGQRIPAYYLPDGSFVVARNAEEALELAKQTANNQQLTPNDLNQDEDVLDTWFSSWLWPITVFDGFKNPDNPDINYYYPTNDLVSAPEILFFWIARMIIAGYEYKGEAPFRNVYLTGIVRDKEGRKMSKQLGNSPDPLELIEKYGADGIRTGMLFSSPAGNDLLFDEKLCEQGRSFTTKIWNAFRLVKGWEVKAETTSQEAQSNQVAIQWFEARFNEALAEIEDHFSKYRMSDAVLSVQDLAKEDFCNWYLEMVKPPYQQPIDKATYEATLDFFERVLKVVHPFMPFITEELWHEIRPREDKDCIIVASWPKVGKTDTSVTAQASIAFDIIRQVRKTRDTKGLSPKTSLDLLVLCNNQDLYQKFGGVIRKLANVSDIRFVTDKVEGAVNFVVKGDEFFIPLEGDLDVAAELEKIEKELEYAKGFLESVDKKLSNERFVANAKESVVAAERQKKADAEVKIKVLEETLNRLRGMQ
ncbi:valine--tRNA ligase [Rhodocytophaga rosea]|uniref:Valine--tRNA ligase n=1 Tax=Rhodocytophaga rosea TaxID=2704465 RepID=A0A6C0GQK2_9BACT|nr:valine--tRNA ligase [Rhodocytophaga rosea]QHT70358.1 valine--tRNA ligase [Rhodocytophaga rosea]